MRAEAVAEPAAGSSPVGRKAEVMKRKGPTTQLIDLRAATMLPGFVDAHGHVMMGGLQALSANLLAPPTARSGTSPRCNRSCASGWRPTQGGQQGQPDRGLRLRQRHARRAAPPDARRAGPDQQDVPILLVHQSGHIIAVNSKAIEVAGISADTPDPQGGVIVRSRGAGANGVFEELAAFPVVMKLLGQSGRRDSRHSRAPAAQLWARYGYTRPTRAARCRQRPGCCASWRTKAA